MHYTNIILGLAAIARALPAPNLGPNEPYTIAPGDTGIHISEVFALPFDILSQGNPGLNWNDLQIGQTIGIPSSWDPEDIGSAAGREGTTTSPDAIQPE
jgi:LysM repeat protein